MSGSVPGVTGRISGFFDHELVYTTPGLLVTVKVCLSQQGERIFAQDLGGLIERALN